MNFLAGIIYVAVMDEVVAFAVMQRILQSKAQYRENLGEEELKEQQSRKVGGIQPEWRFVYTDGMRKLNAFVKEIKQWLMETKRDLYVHFESRRIIIEAVLSNPFLSLFSNVIPNEQALRVLDRFIHFGQKALLQVVKHIISR